MKTLKFITALAVILALTAFAANVDIFAESANKTARVADQVPQNFYLQNENGDVVSLAEHSKAKGLILIFATHEALYSESYENKIIDLNRKYANLGYPVILINPKKPEKKVLDDAFAQEEKIKRLYLLDESRNLYSNPIAVNTPLVYALRKKNEGFNVEFIGAIGKEEDIKQERKDDVAYMKTAVTALVDG